MSLTSIIRELSKKSRTVDFDVKLLTNDNWETLFTTKKLRVASTKTFKVVDLNFDEKERTIDFDELSVHLRYTGIMANRSVENMIKYLGCDLVVNVDYWKDV